MTSPKKHLSSTYNALYHNPLTDKENVSPNPMAAGVVGDKNCDNKNIMKPSSSSLQLCIKLNEPESALGGVGPWCPPSSSSADAWDFSDAEAAPASSWSTLPNRSLLCRPLPLDVGRCTCIIVKEPAPGMRGVFLYSLYTNPILNDSEQYRRVKGDKTVNLLLLGIEEEKGGPNSSLLKTQKDCSAILGSVTTNLMGSKYQIWDQGKARNDLRIGSQRFLGVVEFVPTISTLTGSYRRMTAWIPKQKSMQLKSTNNTQVHHIHGLPKDWEEKSGKAHQLFSRVPHYNRITKRYELDYRERAGRMLPKIQTSARNFQLTMEEKGKQTLLQLGKIAKEKYVMDYRYPLTGYQAFCICLASINPKLCCSV